MKGRICSAIAGCCNSGDLLPPSPPAEKAAARQDQAGQASTGDGAGDNSYGIDIECAAR
jgi:hypothetical protein